MGDFFIATDSVITLLRMAALLATLVILILIGRNELAGLARNGWAWVREEARLSRTKTGYVAAVLGRSSTLLGACTLVFAVFRAPYFTSPGAQIAAGILSSVAVLAGCFIGLTVLAVTHEIVQQTRAGE